MRKWSAEFYGQIQRKNGETCDMYWIVNDPKLYEITLGVDVVKGKATRRIVSFIIDALNEKERRDGK